MKNGGEKAPKNDLGPLLKWLRQTRGWTQGEMVLRLGKLGWVCERSKYGKIEAQMVRVMDWQILYFGRLFGSEFKEALWQLQLRSLRENGESSQASQGGAP